MPTVTRTFTIPPNGWHHHTWTTQEVMPFENSDVLFRFQNADKSTFLGTVHFGDFTINKQGALKITVSVSDQNIIDCLRNGGTVLVAS